MLANYFQIESSRQVFGASASDQWAWESGGAYELPVGKTDLRLRDLTGHLGRASALVLTRDETYRPPQERDAMLQERARLIGISLDPVDRGRFDVIVAGGGVAGVPAAIAAARNGCRVALIHDRPILGGNGSLEMGVPFRGAAMHRTFDRETGIIEDIRNVASIHSPLKIAHGKVSIAAEILVANEPNITLFLDEHVDKSSVSGNRIRAIGSHNTLTGMHSAYEGSVFIDCTGDGWLGYYAGAEYRLGREARAEFDESYAPEKADNATMSGSLTNASVKPGFFYHAENRGRPVEFTLPEWAVEIPNSKNIENLLFAGRNGSFTAIGLGAVRVQVTLASLGQAAGTAAALCAKHDCTPRRIHQRHLKELQQQLLKDDQYIIGLTNEDPSGKARKATVTASSMIRSESGPENVVNGIARPFEGRQNCWESRALAEGPQWVELEFASPEMINTVHVVFDTGLQHVWASFGDPKIENLVKSYTVACFDGSKWHTVAADRTNYQRRVICRFQGLGTKKSAFSSNRPTAPRPQKFTKSGLIMNAKTREIRQNYLMTESLTIRKRSI